VFEEKLDDQVGNHTAPVTTTSDGWTAAVTRPNSDASKLSGWTVEVLSIERIMQYIREMDANKQFLRTDR
jgi:hypothetical protein